MSATLAGIAGALLALIAAIALAAGGALLAGWIAMSGSAGIGAVSVGIPGVAVLMAFVAMLAGFYFGFRWQRRRATRR